MSDEIKALVELSDGRKAWRDGKGRYRDAATGQFIRAGEIQTQDKGGGARARAKAHLLQAVRALGLSAESAEDAWGRLVGVQARIALDGESGARATAAAKLVAQATGLIDEAEAGGADEALQIEMSEESARALLALIRAERAKRGVRDE